MKKEKIRCAWCKNDPLLSEYHDKEWGKLIKDDNKLFERMTMEVFQAGLSWKIILIKREAFNKAFAGFDIKKVARFKEPQVRKLLDDKSIIRNPRKISATIYNANSIIEIQKEYGSFFNFIKKLDVNADLVKQLKKHFKFMGKETATCFLMGCGRIKAHHDKNCFLYKG
jgi:DNA-3-methyladenine glycosylase I